jgi:hypothetical protein
MHPERSFSIIDYLQSSRFSSLEQIALRVGMKEHDAMKQKRWRLKNMKTKIRMLPLVLLLATVTLLPSVLQAHAAADFTISASPSSIQAEAGIPVNVTITVTSTGGFAGTISFSATAGTGYTTSFNPTSVTLSSGGQGTSTLSITADPSCPRPHSVTAKGTSGSLSHNTIITVTTDLC